MYTSRIASIAFFPSLRESIWYSVNNGFKNNISKFSSCSTAYSHSASKSIETGKQDDRNLWVNSKVEDLKPCVGMTIPELIRSSIRGWENETAFECAETGVKYTHAQVLKNSAGFAASLLKSDMGLKRGDLVALLAPNIPEYCSIIFGIWEAGLVPTTVNPVYTANEIQHQLQSSNAKAIVTMPQYLPLVRAAKTKLPNMKSIIVVGEAHEGCHTFSEMTKTDPTGAQFLKGSEMDTLTNLAILLSSSGTTGPPKGVMITHSNITTNLLQYNHHQTGNAIHSFSPDVGQSKLLGILPFFHCYGLGGIMLTTMLKGAHTMTLSRFKPELLVGALRRHQPTDLHLVTPLISFIANNDGVTREDLKSVRSVAGGASPCGPALINHLLDKAGKFVLYQEGFGMTECTGIAHMVGPQIRNTKIGSCGSPIPLTMTKIVDTVTGNTLPRFEKGELCLKGPQVMKGYFNNEEATKDTIDPDGWLHTGDIGYYDDEGCLFIVDRLKELIKVKGLQVAPSELEDLLRSYEGVSDVAVIGVPDAKWGELPRAYIVRKKKTVVNEQDIHDFIQEKVADFKHLRGGIVFVQDIPKTASGKILKKVLVAEYKEKYGIK